MHRVLVALQLLVTPGDLVAGFGSIPIHLPPPADPPAPPPTSPPPPPTSPPPTSPPPTSPPTPPPPASTASPEYVEKHNARRALHEGTNNLVYDADLAADAQAFAESCPTFDDANNDPNQGYGENLFFAVTCPTCYHPDTPYGSALTSWYDQIRDYAWPQAFGEEVSDGDYVGSFTQVVWKETTKVGCGVFTNCTNMLPGSINMAVVCRYSPAGLQGGPGTPASSYYNQIGACKNGMVDDGSDKANYCKELA